MANHCRYLSTEKLQGAEIYDMWLRVSAGVGGDPFEHFLCLGEGVFADCITEVSSKGMTLNSFHTKMKADPRRLFTKSQLYRETAQHGRRATRRPRTMNTTNSPGATTRMPTSRTRARPSGRSRRAQPPICTPSERVDADCTEILAHFIHRNAEPE